MIKVAIVEDNESDRDTLLSFLKRYQAENNVEFTTQIFTNGEDFVANYQRFFDAVFMDIAMPRLNGMEAAKRIRKVDSDVVIVFVTNLAHYAVLGYDVGALGYFLKPISYSDFLLKMTHLVPMIIQKQAARSSSIFVKTNSSFLSIPLYRLRYIESDKHYLLFHLDNEVIKARGRFKDYEEKLDQKFFSSCSKGYLVNLRFLTKVEGDNAYLSEEKLPISRSKRKDFYQSLAKFFSNIKSDKSQ